jgi:tRNA threonylcarbamoyladenosine biosynthesis protein TsaE
MKTYQTASSEETQELGENFARSLIANRQSPIAGAITIALAGDLGAGKTTFTQGFLRGLGIKRRAVSPTFVIMRRYRIISHPSLATGRFKNLYHFDAYRLKQASDLEALEFKITLSDPENIILIEWPERIKEILPKNAVWIKFQHRKKENERMIRF